MLSQNVSCDKGGKNVWFKFKNLHNGLRTYHGFFIRNSTMCLTRSCDGTLSVEKVNSTADRKCFFTKYISLDRKLLDDRTECGRGWKISCPEKDGDAGRKKLKLNPKKARPGALPAALFNL